MASGSRATHRIVLQCRGRGAVGRELLKWGVERADGGDTARGLETIGGPTVEAEAGARLLLGGGDVPMLALHIYFTEAAAAACDVSTVVARGGGGRSVGRSVGTIGYRQWIDIMRYDTNQSYPSRFCICATCHFAVDPRIVVKSYHPS